MAYASTNPFTGETTATFPTATDAAVGAALDRAHEAFLHWSRVPVRERMRLLAVAADLMRDRSAELARLATMEMGMTTLISHAQSRTVAPSILDFYAEHTEEFLRPEQVGTDAAVLRQPTGIVFAIEPWNVPYYQPVRAAAPNLAAGNVVILKHASIVPQCAAAVADIFTDAGLPPGVFTNLYASHEQTSRIIADPRVRGVTLTGSDAAGRLVAAQAAQAVTPTVLELGGSDAMIVLDDADLDLAVQHAMGRFRLCGQTCVSPKRMIVSDSVYGEFLERFRAAGDDLVAGDPRDESVTLGPLSSQGQADQVLKQISAAVSAGSVPIEVGARVPDSGAFVQPTILTGIVPQNPLYGEEIFGPVPMLFSVSDDDEAVRLANDTRYGLGGSVFSGDLQRAEQIAHRIDTGMVWINRTTGTEAHLPFGGTKQSGYGTELGRAGMYQFLNNKLIRRP